MGSCDFPCWHHRSLVFRLPTQPPLVVAKQPLPPPITLFLRQSPQQHKETMARSILVALCLVAAAATSALAAKTRFVLARGLEAESVPLLADRYDYRGTFGDSSLFAVDLSSDADTALLAELDSYELLPAAVSPSDASGRLVVLEHEAHERDGLFTADRWREQVLTLLSKPSLANELEQQQQLMHSSSGSAKFTLDVSPSGVGAWASSLFGASRVTGNRRVLAFIDEASADRLDAILPLNTVVLPVAREPLSPAFSGSLEPDHPVMRLYNSIYGSRSRQLSLLASEADPAAAAEEGPLDQAAIPLVATDPRIVGLLQTISIDSIKATARYLTGEDPTSPLNTRNSISKDILVAANYLQGLFDAAGNNKLFKTRQYTYRTDYGPDVIAVFPGAVEPRKAVVIGAHYDDRAASVSSATQRAPGANDDGSGSSMLVEIAKAIGKLAADKKTANLFRYSIHIVAFSGEEQGLYGSAAYAKLIKNKGDPDTDTIVAMIQGDMIAYNKPGEAFQAAFPTRYHTVELTNSLTALTKSYVPELTVGTSSACCSDHQSFYEAGYPATQFFERNGAIADPMYHNVGDLTERVGYSFQQLYYIARAMGASITTLAEPIF